MTDTVDDVKARVRAELRSIDHTVSWPAAFERIEKALDEPKPTLRERVADVLRDEFHSCADSWEKSADAVLACIAEGADDRLGKTPASILSDGNRRNIIAAVLEVDPEQVT